MDNLEITFKEVQSLAAELRSKKRGNAGFFPR